jgi:predicted nucleic acid-binding protein
VAPVALDADLVIAFLDAADDQHERSVSGLRPRLAAGEEIIVAASVYAEVMVRPLQRGTDTKVAEFLDAIGASVVAIGRPLARRAAQLRARHKSLRSPDALSLATALESGAELLTLDHRLRRIGAREAARAASRTNSTAESDA